MPSQQFSPLVLLYFFYGLAFVCLGLSIAVKDMSESKLQLADSLPSLAVFGFSHGLHEWLAPPALPALSHHGHLLPVPEPFRHLPAPFPAKNPLAVAAGAHPFSAASAGHVSLVDAGAPRSGGAPEGRDAGPAEHRRSGRYPGLFRPV